MRTKRFIALVLIGLSSSLSAAPLSQTFEAEEDAPDGGATWTNGTAVPTFLDFSLGELSSGAHLWIDTGVVDLGAKVPEAEFFWQTGSLDADRGWRDLGIKIEHGAPFYIELTSTADQNGELRFYIQVSTEGAEAGKWPQLGAATPDPCLNL